MIAVAKRTFSARPIDLSYFQISRTIAKFCMIMIRVSPYTRKGKFRCMEKAAVFTKPMISV